MRVVAIIQARLGSSRLPGKALRSLGGRPMLAHVITRALQVPGVDDVMLATSATEPDDALAAIGADCGVRTYRGAQWDVLTRVHNAARLAKADIVVRITGDCPLFCPDVAAAVLKLYHEQPAHLMHYAWNDTACSGWPDGTDVEVFSHSLLELASEKAWRSADREHVTPVIRQLASQVRTLPSPVQLARLKLSVDRMEDFERIERVHQHILPGAYQFAALVQACVAAGLVSPEEVACLS